MFKFSDPPPSQKKKMYFVKLTVFHLKGFLKFYNLNFRISSHPHPVLYLRGVRQEDLEWILDFMYNGEVLLEESELEVFLKIAEELQVPSFTGYFNHGFVN